MDALEGLDTLESFFPVFIDLHQQPCVVFGGGAIAYKKISKLMKYGAKIQVVTAALAQKKIEDLLGQDAITYEELAQEPTKLEKQLDRFLDKGRNCLLVVAATDYAIINELIGDYCRSHHILINNITSPTACNTRFAAVIEGDDYQVAVSSKGQDPKRSVKLRNHIKEHLDKEK